MKLNCTEIAIVVLVPSLFVGVLWALLTLRSPFVFFLETLVCVAFAVLFAGFLATCWDTFTDWRHLRRR